MLLVRPYDLSVECPVAVTLKSSFNRPCKLWIGPPFFFHQNLDFFYPLIVLLIFYLNLFFCQRVFLFKSVFFNWLVWLKTLCQLRRASFLPIDHESVADRNKHYIVFGDQRQLMLVVLKTIRFTDVIVAYDCCSSGSFVTELSDKRNIRWLNSDGSYYYVLFVWCVFIVWLCVLESL